MNYLGHAFLSLNDADTLCGNMIGDFVKGKAGLIQYPEAIRKGIELHRKIDTFTDSHESISRAKEFFRAPYRLYAGAVVDTVLDYFIANDRRLFANAEALDVFASRTYAQLSSRKEYFPDKFIPYYESMLQHNWLVHYRTHEGLKRSLNGLMRRSKHIMEVDSAFSILMANSIQLEAYYTIFINNIIDFVKIEMSVR